MGLSGTTRVAAVAVVLAACGPKRTAPPGHDAGDAGAVVAASDAAPVVVAVAADDAGAPVGTIKVTVTWPTAPTAVRASPGYTACHSPKPPAARVGTLHGVAGALVVIDDPPPGKAPAARVTLRDCLPSPGLVLAGASLEIQNQDERAHAVTIAALGPAWRGAATAATEVARAELPVLGHTVSLPLDDTGAWRVTLDGVHAYAVAAPGATITDDVGQAAFASLPPGTYAVTAWLPPDRRATGEVVVTAGATAELTLTF